MNSNTYIVTTENEKFRISPTLMRNPVSLFSTSKILLFNTQTFSRLPIPFHFEVPFPIIFYYF